VTVRLSRRDKERRALIVRDVGCDCGGEHHRCPLQLTRGDLEDAVRLIMIAGPDRRHVDLRPTPAEVARVTREKEEPMETKPCPKCRAPVAIPVYQAAFLTLRVAAWPNCTRCGL
jgi:hypothetical protein